MMQLGCCSATALAMADPTNPVPPDMSTWRRAGLSFAIVVGVDVDVVGYNSGQKYDLREAAGQTVTSPW